MYVTKKFSRLITLIVEYTVDSFSIISLDIDAIFR